MFDVDGFMIWDEQCNGRLPNKLKPYAMDIAAELVIPFFRILGSSVAWLVLILILCLVWIKIQRRRTHLQLSSRKCNLPTVTWTPKFLNYHVEYDESKNDCTHSQKRKKMASSSITNVLPRMEKLNGPYGMYATVYGVTTKVVHIAHPIPARSVLMGGPSPSDKRRASLSASHRNKRAYVPPMGASKSPAYDHFKNFSGDGVFTSDGSTWKTKRASVIHSLLKGCTRDESPESERLEIEVNRAADIFITKVRRTANESIDGVNVVPLLQQSTIELICRFLTHHDFEFGKVKQDKLDIPESNTDMRNKSVLIDFESQGKSKLIEEEVKHAIIENVTNTSISSSDSLSICNEIDSSSCSSATTETQSSSFDFLSSYLDAVTKIRMIILAQSRSIWFLLPRWIYRTFSSLYRHEEEQMKVIREFARCVCNQAQPGSPLFNLRSRKSHNSQMDINVRDGSLINKDMLDEAITLLFAGQDTSAATISWTLHLLSLNTKAQKRLISEVRSVVDANNLTPACKKKKKRITKKMIAKMPFLDATIKESMRLYPVAPFVVRKLTDDLTIPHDSDSTSIVIPKDTFACVWIYGLHRNKKLWDRPDDFIPERWIDPDIRNRDEAQTNQKGAFMPFTIGPRNCLGQPLAYTILRILLAKIMYDCEFTDDRMEAQKNKIDDQALYERAMFLRKDMQAGFTVLPTGGVRLMLDEDIEKIKTS